MKMKQVLVSKIKPNPFKRFINNGKLNEFIIEKLIEGYNQTTFHENLCARENKKGEVELIYGHHRLEAVKRVYGNNHKIFLRIYSEKEFSDEKMLIDMVRENITQRDTDFHDKKEAIVLAYKWLQTKSKTVKQFDSLSRKGGRGKVEEDSYRSVAKFLSKQGKTINHETVRQYLNIEFKLNKEIKSKIEKLSSPYGKSINVAVWQGEVLSRFDKKEQKNLLKAMQKSSEQRRDKVKILLNQYKNSPNEIKKKVQNGKIALQDISVENFKFNIKQKVEQFKKDPQKLKIIELKKLIRQGENLIGKTNVEIIRTCAFFEGLIRTKIFYELDWNTLYDMLEVAHKRGKQYVNFIEKIRNKL